MTRDLSYFPLSGYTATLRNASDWPDSNENENGLFIGHFYDPDTGKSIFQYTSPTARTRLVSWYNNAVSQYRAGNISMAMTYLGRALHYAEDLSTPHHAANLAAYASYHLEYEQWVQEHQTNYIELNAPAATYNWARRTSISDMGHNLSYSTIILIMGTLI
jgi:phospholipase C